MSSAAISKIHVNNATRMSLNDRFTAFAERPTVQQNNRSRSMSREPPRVDPRVSSKNRHFLMELERKHKMRAALKLKRRSMRAPGINGGILKRGSIKAMRLSPSGKPIKTNSLTKIATMKADLVSANNSGGGRYRRPSALRRSMSTSSIAGRLGNGRPVVGGAAERVARRRMARGRGRPGLDVPPTPRRRSRSRARSVEPRGNGNVRRQSRSRSRSRARVNAIQKKSLPITARLGVKPGATRSTQGNADRRQRDRRQANRGVTTGRVNKPPRRNNPRSNNIKNNVGGSVGNGRQPVRGRGRSRSRTRNASAPAQQQRRNGPANQIRNRGRSRQRNARGNTTAGGNKNRGNNGMRNGQKPQVRGRSRSRGGRNEGNRKTQINKDELDKELDQYMATTKTENDLDYLLKN